MPSQLPPPAQVRRYNPWMLEITGCAPTRCQPWPLGKMQTKLFKNYHKYFLHKYSLETKETELIFFFCVILQMCKMFCSWKEHYHKNRNSRTENMRFGAGPYFYLPQTMLYTVTICMFQLMKLLGTLL